MHTFGSILLIITTIISCNESQNKLLNTTHIPISTTTATSIVSTLFMTTQYHSHSIDFTSMTLLGHEIDFCLDASIISEACALIQIIQFVIFFIYRNEDGIQSRRPIFTYSFCIISSIYLLLIIPLICSPHTILVIIPFIEFIPFMALYLLRCFCMFVWFETLICKYWFLYFDYNYVILLQLQAMHAFNMKKNNKSSFNVPKFQRAKSEWFQKHKKDFGNPKKASVYIAIYFLLCLGLLTVMEICEEHRLYIVHQLHSLHPYLVTISLTEVVFITMCYVPFITAIIFTFRISKFTESWKIKEEICAIFMFSSVLFLIDTALTGITYLDESTRFALKFMLESLIFCWTTLISTIFVTYYIVDKRNKSLKAAHPRRSHHPKKSTLIFSLKRTSHKNKKRTRSLSDMMGSLPQRHVLTTSSDDNLYRNYEIPLGYILANQIGYSSFLQHCSNELNIENLLFLAHVCYFKKRFLDRIKDRQLTQNAIRKETEETLQLLDIVNEERDENEEEQLIRYYGSDGEYIELDTVYTPSVANLENPQSPTIIKPGSENMESKTFESISTIQTDIAVYNDNEDEDDDDGGSGCEYPDVIEWSASNCLAILTFRMCHNFERDRNRLTLIDVDESDASGAYVPLYVLATNLYTVFIRENSEYEINLPSKMRTQLHFFFHQNFKDLEENDKQFYEYRLFHIFDKSWSEIWRLMILNSYRRFLGSQHYESIQKQLELALTDELPSLHRLIVTNSNNDKHIANLIVSHDPHRRKVIRPKLFKHSDATDKGSNALSYGSSYNVHKSSKSRLNTFNVEEIHDLQPISLIQIDVDPLPIDEQVAHFGKTMVKVKQATV